METTETTEDKHELETITQVTYKKPEYEDSTWEIIGEVTEDEGFAPMEISVISREGLTVDPMFADYGGLENDPSPRRWHLPEHLASEEKRLAAEEAEAAKRKNVFSDEELAALLQKTEENARQSAIEEIVQRQHEKFTAIEERLKAILQDLAAQVKERMADIEKLAVKFAVDVSGKVVHHVVEVVPDYIGHIIGQAIQLCGSASISKIRVSPQDLEFIEVVGIQKHLAGLTGGWAFVGDPSIKSGCIIETSAGEVDYQIDKAWIDVRDNVLKAIE